MERSFTATIDDYNIACRVCHCSQNLLHDVVYRDMTYRVCKTCVVKTDDELKRTFDPCWD